MTIFRNKQKPAMTAPTQWPRFATRSGLLRALPSRPGAIAAMSQTSLSGRPIFTVSATRR